MKLAYVIDYCFKQTPDGRVWTDTSYSEEFWHPYLCVYEGVTLISRVAKTDHAEASWRRVDGNLVTVASLPAYIGPIEYLNCAREIRRSMHSEFLRHQAVILRMPSNLARCAARELGRMGRPFAVDVVGDPQDALAPGVVEMRGRPFFRFLFTHAQRRICAAAAGAAYVAETPRARYPVGDGRPAMVCSDVRLDGTWLRETPRVHSTLNGVHLLTVATLSQKYKGIQVLLKALSRCIHQGNRLSLTVVGSGKYRSEFEQSAKELGIARHVRFIGNVPWGPELIEVFDRADVFILPSLVEAMPRALLEAMARALPAIGTRVGSIHEVLATEDLVNAGDAFELAEKIMSVTQDPARMDAMSIRNLAKARLFAASILQTRWFGFHLALHQHFKMTGPAISAEHLETARTQYKAGEMTLGLTK